METEELNFLLQSGIVLCKLAAIVVPDTGIETDDLQVILILLFIQINNTILFQSGNLMTKKKNISHFLSAAIKYGVPDRYLFKPEDLAVQAHFYKQGVTLLPSFIHLFMTLVLRVTRAVFALAEMTNMDPGYTGPEFDFDRIVKDLMNKVRGIINTSLFHQMIINGTQR